jgi:hypothetical protein
VPDGFLWLALTLLTFMLSFDCRSSSCRSSILDVHVFAKPLLLREAFASRSFPLCLIPMCLIPVVAPPARHILPLLIAAFCLAGCGTDDASEDAPADSAAVAPAAQASPDMPDDPVVDSLTQTQQNRLGPSLQRFLTGDSMATGNIVAEGEQRNGEKVFAVIIRSDDADALRDAGIPLNSVAGSIITARLTADEILRVSSMPSVRSVQSDREVDQTGSPSEDERPRLRPTDSDSARQMPSPNRTTGGGATERPQSGGLSQEGGGPEG